MRGDFTRGIFASVYTAWKGVRKPDGSTGTAAEDATGLYKAYYENAPFVHISDKGVSMKEVINTNKVLIHLELYEGYIHIACVLDNLIKGASGQAVENMNLMFGLEQTTGLRLKPSAF